MPPPLFSKVPSVAKLERGRSRGVSVDVKSSPRTPLGKFMKKVTSRGASAATASQSHDALHLELTLEDGVEVGRADLILLAGVDGGEVRELLEEVTRLATSNDAVGPEVGRLRRLAAELLREFRPLLLDSAELGSLPSGGGGVHCLRCYLRHVKRSLRIISHRKDDEVNRLTVRAELARLVRLAEKMEELRPLLQQEVLYHGERGGGGEGRRAGRSVDKGAASFRLAQEREAAAAAARHRALLLAQLHQQSARRFWERAHRRLWQLRDAAAAAAAGGGAPPAAGTAAPPAHALPWEVFSAQFDEDYPAAALTPARGALALLRGLLRDERGGVFLGEFACFTDGDGVIDAVAKAQRAGHEPLFTSPGERSAILERTMKITRAPAPGRPPSVGAADIAHHSQVRMCLAMCGTIAKVRQTDELVVVEFAESGLLRRYSRNVQQALDLSRETGGRLDQSQITLGERHPDTVKTVDEVEKETQAAAAAEAAAAARAEAEGGGGGAARARARAAEGGGAPRGADAGGRLRAARPHRPPPAAAAGGGAAALRRGRRAPRRGGAPRRADSHAAAGDGAAARDRKGRGADRARAAAGALRRGRVARRGARRPARDDAPHRLCRVGLQMHAHGTHYVGYTGMYRLHRRAQTPMSSGGASTLLPPSESALICHTSQHRSLPSLSRGSPPSNSLCRVSVSM